MATLTAIDLEDFLPATFTAPELTDEQFLAMCELFPEATLEYTEEGEIIVMPPTDPKNSARVLRVARRLGNWAEESGRGEVSGPDGGFRFRTGARAGRQMRLGTKVSPRKVTHSPCLLRNSSSRSARRMTASRSFATRCGAT